MLPIDENLERADELAHEVVNHWGRTFSLAQKVGNADEFGALLGRARSYLGAKEVADNHRQSNRLTERDAAEETATRQAFAEAYKTYWEKHQPAAETIEAELRRIPLRSGKPRSVLS